MASTCSWTCPEPGCARGWRPHSATRSGSGRLAEGARLPSSRALAADLGVARNTVAEVYTQLTAEGWLTARSGRAPPSRRARPAPTRPRPRRPRRPRIPATTWAGGARPVRVPARRLAGGGAARRSPTPRRGLRLRGPARPPALRGALAEYLARTRGVAAAPGGENIVICSGFAHGLAVVSRALRAAGAATVAVEEYGHPVHRDIVTASGLRAALLPARRPRRRARRGRRRRRGAAHARPPVSARHDPAPQRRRAVAGWGGWSSRTTTTASSAMTGSRSAPCRRSRRTGSIYAGTASKSLAPALRLGWLVVPPRLLDAVTAQPHGGPLGAGPAHAGGVHHLGRATTGRSAAPGWSTGTAATG